MAPLHAMLLPVASLVLLSAQLASGTTDKASKASSFVGSTQTFAFPPTGASVTENASDFPDGTQINVFGPTPTGDEALAIATAPVSPVYDNTFPLVEPGTEDHAPSLSGFSVIHSWGNLSPFRSPSSSSASTKSAFGVANGSPRLPAGCSLNQVHLLHRHGARYPTTGAAPSKFAAALNAVAASGKLSASGPLAFLNTWTYKLGAEILTPFGRGQMFELGVGFRVKYGDLLKGFSKLPVWRTTSEERMLDSALHFAAGFFGVQDFAKDYHQLIEIEALGFNSTLAPYEQCANANNAVAGIASNFTNAWAEVYLKNAQKRLAPHLSGLALNATWLFAMQQTCAYETVALGYSAFCDLFTEEEWNGYEYSVDLSFWYDNGPGNPAVAAQGVGWVQELVSRLSGERIAASTTTTNATIVGSNITFPLDQPIYVDATHDTVISAIVVAMNFTSMARTGPLPSTHIPKDRSYIVNQISPFGANLVGQVLSCPSPASPASSPTHIRWLLNDAVVPLTGIAGCAASTSGLCPLKAFVAGMKQRIREIDFAEGCFGNFTVPNPDLLVGGMIGGPAARKIAA
ncbi:Acid phosphatase [Mycena indigotica]|uniref:Acid phosphatase n=1 Tax=Mycena indigotica TaxID=2126181 RepID=A0A8H6S5K0_9AGAR|nr:Acid phosphatase [Mycena indigotica]KAF7292227.1 Acid phosphatase [Mycena indigotica]